jgi:hypothetical protein
MEQPESSGMLGAARREMPLVRKKACFREDRREENNPKGAGRQGPEDTNQT